MQTKLPAHIGKRATKGARRQKFRVKERSAAQKAQDIARKNVEWSDEEEISSDSEEWYSGDEHDQRAYQKGGYLKVIPGSTLNGRYQVQKRLGWGHFAMVFLAIDKKAAKGAKNKYVALKIQKSSLDYQEAAEEEIPFLEKVSERAEATGRDPLNVVRMLDHFVAYGDHGKHYVMVFELMGICPSELLQDFSEGLPIAMVKHMMKQLLNGLDFIHTEPGIIHMDIKPENVLFAKTNPIDESEIELRKKHYAQKADRKALRESKKKLEREKLGKNQKKRLKDKIKRLEVKVDGHEELEKLPDEAQASVDFVEQFLVDLEAEKPVPECVLCDLGTACWTDKVNTFEVGTRYGRPPEMLVGLRYDPPADVWAAACLAVELATGEPLFDPQDEDDDGNPLNVDAEHLRLIAEALGPKFPKYLHNASGATEFLSRKGEVRHAEVDFVGLKELLAERLKWPAENLELFTEFLLPMLSLRPMDRASAAEMYAHSWLDITTQDIEESKEWFEENKELLSKTDSEDEEEESEPTASEDHEEGESEEAKDSNAMTD